MMRVGRARRDAQLLMWTGMAFLLVVACNTAEIPPVPPVRTFGPTGLPMGHPAFVLEAESNYTYGSERPAISVDTSSGLRTPTGSLPTITIATATMTDTAGRDYSGRFIARLHSTAAYPVMGIDSGYNYIWRDSGGLIGQPFRHLVVPKNLARQMYWLKRDTTVATYVAGAATEPRLAVSPVAYGMCGNGCGSGHCAAKDSQRVFFAPADDVLIHIKKT